MLMQSLPSRSNAYWTLTIAVLWAVFVCLLPEMHVPVQEAALGTLAAIGGGMAAAGIAGGFLSRPDKNAPNQPLLDRAEELQSPDPEAFQRFRRLAVQARPGLDEFMMAQEAQGGGQRMAELAAARQAREAGDQALNQFGQFRLNQSQQANRLISQAQQMQMQQENRRSQATMSLFNNIASIGGSLATQGLGQLGQMRMMKQSGNSMGQTPGFRTGRTTGLGMV